jgi:RNA polymerase sigma-70 factor, ECF subfamily
VTSIVGDDLLPRLRAGDDAAFATIVTQWSPVMLRVARPFVASNTEAEEVVQETWGAIVAGLPRFEGRSSLRTWAFTILTNRARTARQVPFSALAEQELSVVDRAVDPTRFNREGGWGTPPRRWEELPEDALEAGEIRDVLRARIAELSTMQRLVITMRDVDDWSNEEVAEALQISTGHVRVLLHRARSRLRATLEEHLT